MKGMTSLHADHLESWTPEFAAPPVRADGTQAAEPLYLQIALRIAQLLASGALPSGQRLPSVRDSAAQNNVSVATVVQAYRHLEENGLVQPRAKSGYFLAAAAKPKALALVRKGLRKAEPVAQWLSHSSVAPGTGPSVSFAGYSPKDKDFFDTDRIRVALSRSTRLRRDTLTEYTSSTGMMALRNAVAVRALHLGCALKADNIVITSGCINAVAMCLQAVTQPGDMVAIESPTFFGFLDLLEALRLKAFALPTDPRTGVSLPALQLALETQSIKALLLVPTLSNPLASVMPLTQKRALARMVAQYHVPLIEDVVFNLKTAVTQ
jgi:DNA-binding transcriptional MocR family regulator